MKQAAALLNPCFLVNTVFSADGDLAEVVVVTGMKPGRRL